MTPPVARPLKVMHIITDLQVGGAEMMLSRLLAQMDPRRFENQVVSLASEGILGAQIRALGVQVESLGMKPGRFSAAAFLRLVSRLRSDRPDVVQTWLYHADLLGGLAARAAGGLPVVWNLRHSSLEPGSSKRSTRAVVWLLARLSGWLPQRIVSCSLRAEQLHVEMGYPPEKMLVIPNGFDLGLFQPDEQARREVRAELTIPPDAPLIGMAARYNPQKDFHNFLEAARSLSGKDGTVRFLLCGKGADLGNAELTGWLQEYGLKERFTLAGLRHDMPRLMNALDIFSLSSAYGEAFPQTVGEAMACGIPCVVTDVGDSSYLVGETGLTVPPRDAPALAQGWEQMLGLSVAERRSLGEQARQRIQQNFSIAQITRRYEELYRQMAGRP